MQFQIPQFIETEDKIVGPLSIRQFVYIAAVAGISVILYFAVRAWIWILLSIPLIGLGIALALVKINGRPFSKMLLAGFLFYWNPQTYVWQPDQPNLPKTQEVVEKSVGFSVEKLFSGLALKKTWGAVQVGSKAPEAPAAGQKPEQRYQIFHKITGEHDAARRVDYR